MEQWKLYTTREIKPRGWLKDQLTIQAKGLSGNLDKIWRDVRDSQWIGGDAEGWERVPYWLDGFIPMAYLLEDEDMIARAKSYVEAIVAAQQADGWICPCTEAERPGYDTWAVILISKALTVYYECSGDERIPGVVYRLLQNYYDLLKNGTIRLFNWGEFRWFEAFVALNFLQERYGEAWISDLARILRDQGADYNRFTERWKSVQEGWNWDTHIVNLAMMMKYEAVSHRLLGEAYQDRAEALYQILKDYNGTPVELFTGDECLSGLSPIHGTELCAVVEQMYSYELLYAYTGDTKWLERLEVMAFNALPATFREDMWTHQYDQLSNQSACRVYPGPSVFSTNSPEAHLFGLEPNYGCCTANLSQGWPKLALSAYMHRDNTVVSAVTIPSQLTTEAYTITLDTNYPFQNSFRYSVSAKQAFDLVIRVPSFAQNVLLDGAPAETGNLRIAIEPGQREITLSYDVAPRFEARPYDLTTVKCGSLVFSVPLKYRAEMHQYERGGVPRVFPYCDYELIPESDWNWAYCDDSLTVERRQPTKIPFSQAMPPVVIKTKAVHIDWGIDGDHEDLCAKEPKCREPLDEAQEIALYPYGCSRLRMTELPKVKA